jgi:serine acetyltransferase
VIKAARIGTGSTVGGNAFVNRDVPDGETWAGVPARRIAPAKGAGK